MSLLSCLTLSGSSSLDLGDFGNPVFRVCHRGLEAVAAVKFGLIDDRALSANHCLGHGVAYLLGVFHIKRRFAVQGDEFIQMSCNSFSSKPVYAG